MRVRTTMAFKTRPRRIEAVPPPPDDGSDVDHLKRLLRTDHTGELKPLLRTDGPPPLTPGDLQHPIDDQRPPPSDEPQNILRPSDLEYPKPDGSGDPIKPFQEIKRGDAPGFSRGAYDDPDSSNQVEVKPDLENEKEGPHYDVIQHLPSADDLDPRIKGGVEKMRVSPEGEIINGETVIGKSKTRWESDATQTEVSEGREDDMPKADWRAEEQGWLDRIAEARTPEGAVAEAPQAEAAAADGPSGDTEPEDSAETSNDAAEDTANETADTSPEASSADTSADSGSKSNGSSDSDSDSDSGD